MRFAPLARCPGHHPIAGACDALIDSARIALCGECRQRRERDRRRGLLERIDPDLDQTAGENPARKGR